MKSREHKCEHIEHMAWQATTLWTTSLDRQFKFLHFRVRVRVCVCVDWQERLSRAEHSKADNNCTITIVLNGLLFAARMPKFT